MSRKFKTGISIIIPTFNRAKFLYATLICLSNQKVQDNIEFEIIIVDSGNDESESVVNYFRMNGLKSLIYKKIKKSKNRALLRNIGTKISKYSILCFLDNDMLVPPNFIQTHFDEHKINKHTVLMGARRFLTEFEIFEFGEEKLQKNFNALENLSWYSDDRIYKDVNIQPWRYVFSHTLSMEKDDFLRAGKFNIHFGNHWGYEDIELGIRLQKLGCDFKLLKKHFNYHQPHFDQSNQEQHDVRNKGILLLRIHNSFETELYRCFYSDFDDYYLILKRMSDSFILPPKTIVNKFDIILGCLIPFDNDVFKSKKLHLGVFCPEKNNSKRNVFIVNNFFEFPEIIRISIIFEAFRISPKVYFKDITSNQADIVINAAIASGIVVKIEKNNGYSIFIRDWNQDSKLFLILLPDILQPEKRYVYLWLANKLLETNHYIKIRDMKNTESFSDEDLRLEKEENYRIERCINKYFGKNRLQFIGSSAMLMTNMNIEFPKTESAYIFFDDDYKLIFNSIKKQHIGKCSCFNESYYSLLSTLSVYDITKEIIKNKVQYINNTFICFMENGFLEDGIDIILRAFKMFSEENTDFLLTIKMPNYDDMTKKIYPLHSESSKQNKMFLCLRKFIDDYQLLIKSISDAGIGKNVNIIRTNMTFKNIVELINSNESLVCASRSCCTSPEVYAAILLRKRVIIPEHLHILDDFKDSIISVPSDERIFNEELNLPISCINSNYIAYHIKEYELLAALKKKSKYISDDCETETISKGEAFLNRVFCLYEESME